MKYNICKNKVYNMLESMGGEPYFQRNYIISKTVCHRGDSHKLYYYQDGANFYCYTCCGGISIGEFVKNNYNIADNLVDEFIDNNLNENYFNFSESTVDFSDVAFNSQNVVRVRKTGLGACQDAINESVLSRYLKALSNAWYNENIDVRVIDKFGIRFDVENNRIIIPQRDEHGVLRGIRGRDIEHKCGAKYYPLYANKTLYNANNGHLLYGYSENKKYIKDALIIVEGEKSVLKLASNGYHNAVALYGSNLTENQIALINKLGVKKIIVALDKEFEKKCDYPAEFIYDCEKAEYIDKLNRKFTERLKGYDVKLVVDNEDLLDFKDSPVDKGIEVFEQLVEQATESGNYGI